MLDIKFIRENKEKVIKNIENKFQDEKVPLVEEVISLYDKIRELKQEGDLLRKKRNETSKEIGSLMKKDPKEANQKRSEVKEINEKLVEIEKEEEDLGKTYLEKMYLIPQMMHESVPIGKSDLENVEIEKFGEPVVPDYEIPHHADILKSLDSLDKESAGRTSGAGFYYLEGIGAELHSAILSYAREFMIKKGFKYVIPPFMVRGSVVSGVMSFEDMAEMMYKIEDEDLYLIGTSEHSMIGRFIGELVEEDELPLKYTSYSPCFRKEVGSHGIEERGLYRVHQFEKQEMVIISKPEDSFKFYEEMYMLTVELFKALEIPVRTLEICSGDLADLKVKSCDVEAWSPRQEKYFEVGSCSTLGDAQARRLKFRVRGKNGTYYPHTLNNTVLASPRALIAFLENHYQEDGSIYIPKVLRKYFDGRTYLN